GERRHVTTATVTVNDLAPHPDFSLERARSPACLTRTFESIATAHCHRPDYVGTLYPEMRSIVGVVLEVVLGLGLAGGFVASLHHPIPPQVPGLEVVVTPEPDHEEHGSSPGEGPPKQFLVAGATKTVTNSDRVTYRDGQGTLREAALDHSRVAA